MTAELFDGSFVTFDCHDVKTIEVGPGEEGRAYSLLICWVSGCVDRAVQVSIK